MAKLDITKWPVLSNLNEEFINKIKLLFVFGETGKQAIIVTNDENVYALGRNYNGCLGLKSNKRTIIQEPTLIEELCQKYVIDIHGGQFDECLIESFVLALTQNNQVFSWGANNYGQLGNGSHTACYFPNVINELNGKNVIDIKCRERYCLALTQSGEVYYWGDNLVNNPNLMVNIKQQNIISISCGNSHSLALTDEGKVYSWGNNENQINNKNVYKTYPCLITNIPNNTKIQCGPQHSLMLSSEGDIYSFGNNYYGQCSDEVVSGYESPIKLAICDKFIDIAATKYFNISVGLSIDGFCYYWGEYGNQKINTPIKTTMNKIIDVLEYCSKVKVTFDRIYYFSNHIKINKMPLNKMSEKFNKKEYSDITFKFENNLIYSQKLYLQSVCNHFDVLFSSDNWRECNENVIQITQYSYEVYYAFIKFLYTNKVNIKTEDAIDLLDLANSYFEDELKHQCVQIIKSLVSFENVSRIYSNAIAYKSEELRQHCVNYFYDIMKNKSTAELILEKLSKI